MRRRTGFILLLLVFTVLMVVKRQVSSSKENARTAGAAANQTISQPAAIAGTAITAPVLAPTSNVIPSAANPPAIVQPALPAIVANDGQISESARREIEALQREKDSLTAAQKKLDSQLVFAVKRGRNETIAGGSVPQLQIGATPDAKGNVLVDISANVTPALLGQIQALNGVIEDSLPNESPVRVSVALAQIENIAALPDVKFIRPAVLPMLNNTDPEGVTVHRDFGARTNFGVDGTGIKIGVMSGSEDHLAQAQSNGNLGPVTVLPGQSGEPGTGEGTAMMEIVHAMAPGAQLFYATGGPTEKQFATNILNLRFTYGCDIIVDDVSFFDESPFQDAIIARAVNAVTTNGAWYFSSAANSGNLDSANSGTWEGDFLSGGSVASPTNGLIHNFGTVGSPTNFDAITGTNVEQGLTSLLWSDPLGASTNDYDLYVLDLTGAHVVSASINPQTGTQDPLEQVVPPALNQRLVVVLVSGTNRYLHIDTARGQLKIGTAGSTRGHNAQTNAFTVAAVNSADAYPFAFAGGAGNPVENFSSDGPRRMFYQANGTPLTPGNFSSTGGVSYQKPDIAAADGVTTDVPGGFAPFFGTSAAAPHAAAIAALVKAYNPATTTAQLHTIFNSSALDIMGAGVDRDSGVGIVMAFQALQATTPPPPMIGAVSPPAAAPSQVIYVSGTGLGTTTNVQFNGVSATFTIQLNSIVSVIVPVGATSGQLKFMTPGGTASVAFTVLPLPPPPNDNFANAIVETGNAFIASTLSTSTATKETGEPNHAGNSGGKSVWYRWTAPANGVFMVDTIGSSFNTLLGVYTGGSVSGLTPVASNAGGGTNGTSLLTFLASTGTTYQIAVDGSNGASGHAVVRLSPGTNTVYTTGFEPADGFAVSNAISGQAGWTNTGTGTSGIVSNFFTGQGQQGYIGNFTTSPVTNTFADRPLGFNIDTNTRPVIQFNVEMAVIGSTSGGADQFWWIARNTSGHALFGFDFNNSTDLLGYSLDSGGLVTALGYSDSTLENLSVAMDFGRNLWSATLNGTTITIGAQPITTTAAALTLGDIDAGWVFNNTNNPGNNYMLFDNYTVTAGPSVVPRIIVPPLGQTAPAGSNVFLGVVAEGNAPLTYQWSLNGSPLSGATNSTITLQSATPGETGTFSVVVNNGLGSASAQAVVTITNLPPAGNFGEPIFQGTNGVGFNVNVVPGNYYRLLASPDLTNWTTLETFYANGSNTMCFDPVATNFSRRFYRLVSP